MHILGGSETNTHAFFFLQLSCLRAIAAKTCKNHTVCEPEPRCMPSEAEAREDPFTNDTRIVQEDVCWEEEGKVLHCTNYNQNNNSSWWIMRPHDLDAAVPAFCECFPYTIDGTFH